MALRFLLDMGISPRVSEFLVSAARTESPPVVTLRLRNPNAAEQVQCLQRLLAAVSEDNLRRCLITAEHNRFRRRSLPIR